MEYSVLLSAERVSHIFNSHELGLLLSLSAPVLWCTSTYSLDNSWYCARWECETVYNSCMIFSITFVMKKKCSEPGMTRLRPMNAVTSLLQRSGGAICCYSQSAAFLPTICPTIKESERPQTVTSSFTAHPYHIQPKFIIGPNKTDRLGRA